MAKRPRPWIVAPHRPIERLSDNLRAVVGEMPGNPRLLRRMAIARRSDGDLVFFNAVPIADDALAELRVWGRPAWVVIPNAYHKLDAHPFRERLGVQLLCGADADARVRAQVAVDGHAGDLPPDPAVRLLPLGGTRQGEVAMVVTDGAGATAVFADAFMNVPAGAGWLNALLGVSGGPKCPPLFRYVFVRDKRALARDLAALAALPGLARLVPSHGDVVDHDAAAILRRCITRDLGAGI